VLPVKLDAGQFYLIGINWDQPDKLPRFRSKHHEAWTSAIYFCTRGAPADVAARVKAPFVIETDPPNDAQDVDAETKGLSFTFNMPMAFDTSFLGSGGAYYPGGTHKVHWSEDNLTCTLRVSGLIAGQIYEVVLSGRKGFKSKWGVPL